MLIGSTRCEPQTIRSAPEWIRLTCRHTNSANDASVRRSAESRKSYWSVNWFTHGRVATAQTVQESVEHRLAPRLRNNGLWNGNPAPELFHSRFGKQIRQARLFFKKLFHEREIGILILRGNRLRQRDQLLLGAPI